MSSGQIKHIDLIRSWRRKKYRKILISHLSDCLESTEHKNNPNYINLKDEFDSFLSFQLLLEGNNRPVAFSGLYNEGYNDKTIARALSRTFYFPQARSTSMGWSRERSLASQIMAPIQTNIAKDLGLGSIFVSVEGCKRRGGLKRLTENLNNSCPLPYRWHVLDGYFNTCRVVKNGVPIPLNDDPSCWQHVAALGLKSSSPLISLPNRNCYPS